MMAGLLVGSESRERALGRNGQYVISKTAEVCRCQTRMESSVCSFFFFFFF